MGAVQSLVLSSEGAAAATTLVIAGAVGYRISKMVKPQEEENGEKGEGRTEEDEQTPGGSRSSPDAGKARKKKSKKRAAVPQAAVTGTSDAGAVTSAQVVPGGFDVAAAPNVPTKETSKSKSKGKTKQAPASTGRTGTSPQVGDGGDDDDSSATPSEAPPPSAASASGSKSKKSKKKKKSAPGASPSTSILTLANASSSKTTLSASNPGAVEPSAVLVSNPGTTGAVVRAEETLHGSKSKKPLYSGDASTTEDNEDDGKPFLASLSSSRQQAIGQSRTPLAPSLAMQSGAYPDTDSSWTHVRRGGPHGRRDNSSSGLGQLSTSDAGVVSSVTDDGYPSSSPVAERAEDTEEDEAQEQAQDLGSGTSYVRASGDNTQRKTLAERLLPKPRKTGVEDMLETPDHPTLSRVVRVRPLAGEKPVTGFSWADYEDVHTDEGAGHDADGEDDGWGVVRSRRSRPDYSSSIGATSSADANAASRTAQAKSSGALTKKQRQNAKKREAVKSAKAEAEADRLATLAKHKQQLEKEKMMDQLSKGRSKVPSGGMHASVDDNGKLVWE